MLYSRTYKKHHFDFSSRAKNVRGLSGHFFVTRFIYVIFLGRRINSK